MPVTTQNISCTSGSASNTDFTKADATVNDKVMVVIYDAGAPILVKNSAANGGSTDEIGITASTKYILKLTAADTAIIPNGATYKLFLIPATEAEDMRLFIGTFTVASATITSPVTVNSANSFSYSQYFTDDAQFDVDLPAAAYIEKIILEDLAGPAVTLDIGTAEDGAQIVSGAAVGNGTDIVDATLVAQYFSTTADTEIWLHSDDWNSGGVMVTVVWKELVI